jgi:hypothetical protein
LDSRRAAQTYPTRDGASAALYLDFFARSVG